MSRPLANRWLRAIAVLALSCAPLLAICANAEARRAPLPTRVVYKPGEIVPIPAAIPHEEGDMVDRRILPDLRWIAQRYPIYVTDGYSGPLPDGEWVGCHGCHVKGSDHTNGLAVDVVPLGGSPSCDASWAPITRLAEWAEPVQNQPVPPFRWVGYNGDAGHGCGNHLHLSWNHSPAPQYQLAEWVEVFPVGSPTATPKPAPETGSEPGGARSAKPGGAGSGKAASTPKASAVRGPAGGVASARTGGYAPRGYGE